jgi:hypothetical protein
MRRTGLTLRKSGSKRRACGGGADADDGRRAFGSKQHVTDNAGRKTNNMNAIDLKTR